MDKITIHVIIALTISSLLLLPSLSSASNTSNVTISASGFVQYSAPGSSIPINKATYIYGAGSFTDAQTSYIASHFRLLDVSFSFPQSALKSIKTKNPSMKVIGYNDLIGVYSSDDDWATINANEAWFVHDVNGNRLVNAQFGWYLMDVGSGGWRQHYVSYVNSKLGMSLLDGIFADDVWDILRTGEGEWTAQSSYIKSSDMARWHNDTVSMLQYVKANLLSGKILLINTDESRQDYLNLADGKMAEGKFHASWLNLDDHSQAAWITSDINSLAQDMATGKIVWAASGTTYPGTAPPNATTQSQIATTAKYCYAAFLCALNGTQPYFSFTAQSIGGYTNDDGSYGYYSIMDTNIGQPIGAYYASQNVYIRNFTSGKVLLSPSANSYTINLGGNYQFLNGTVVSSVVLAPYSGEILLSLT